MNRHIFKFDNKAAYKAIDIVPPMVSLLKDSTSMEYDLDEPYKLTPKTSGFIVKNFKNGIHYLAIGKSSSGSVTNADMFHEMDHELLVDRISYGVLKAGEYVTKEAPYWGVIPEDKTLEDYINKSETDEYDIAPLKYVSGDGGDIEYIFEYLHIQGLKGPHEIVIRQYYN